MYSQRQLFLAHVAQTSPEPPALEIVQAAGMYLKDAKGKRYMDLISGISVSNLGHRHPQVVRAIQKQLKKYMHLMVYGEYVQSPQVKLATLLTQQLPEKLSSVYFTNSGSEAIEGAMKLAKRITGRHELACFHHSYHGSTQGALSLIGDEYFRNAFRPLLPSIRRLDYNQIASLENITGKTAAVILEPVQAEAGIIPAQHDFMQALEKKCKATGTLIIMDEVQSGYGRTGALFAFPRYNIIPDILVLAKGFGGGMPLGAFISSYENMQQLTHSPVLGHITTFGGHPVSCAAGYETLRILLNSDLIQQVQEKSNLFAELLQHPSIKQIRRDGFFIGLEFENAETNKKIIQRCIEKGVITDWFLFNDKTLRIAPPLIITKEQIRWACKRILEAMDF